MSTLLIVLKHLIPALQAIEKDAKEYVKAYNKSMRPSKNDIGEYAAESIRGFVNEKGENKSALRSSGYVPRSAPTNVKPPKGGSGAVTPTTTKKGKQ